MTRPRALIVEALRRAGSYVTADDIFDEVRGPFPGIGLATVYRTVQLLCDMGIITKFEFGEGKARYELAEKNADGNHYHVLICTSCNGVFKYTDFSEEEKELFSRIEKELSARYGYRIDRHVVQFYGICPGCLERARTAP